MNSIALSDNYVKDELFATLDTSTKKINISNKISFLLSDTVGFIRNLPDNLVASFRSTLGEITDSDLILKVVDISSDELEVHIETINSVLNHLKISDQDFLIIFNKIDKLSDSEIIKRLKLVYPEAIFVSANDKINIDKIINSINSKMKKNNTTTEISVSYENGKLINEIYNNSNVLKKIDENGQIKFLIEGNKNSIDKILSKIKK